MSTGKKITRLKLMNINIITLFPEIFLALNSGLLGQAIERKDIVINIVNLRDYSMNEYGQVDDKPCLLYTSPSPRDRG